MGATNQDQQHSQVQEHFDQAPYPDMPFEHSGCQNLNDTFLSSIITPFYRRSQQLVESKGKLILDVGCGSGVTSHKLADANPGAIIVGIDISAASIAVAKSRLLHHGYDQAQFFAMPAEDLTELGMTFDYINCHETLYLLPDPLAGLQAMAAVLKPDGIIRANLHSQFQRQIYYRAQRLFKFLGLMEDCSLETGISTVRELMESLDNSAELKGLWNSMARTDESITANFLLRGDRGFTIPETFELMESADLDFISMVNWSFWDIRTLFKDPNQIPEEFELVLAIASESEKLHLYEMLNAKHRLIDFWCGHSNSEITYQSPSEWEDDQWNRVKITLHPVLKAGNYSTEDNIKTALGKAIAKSQTFNLSEYISVNTPQTITLFSNSVTCLYLLWQEALSFEQLLQIWLKVRPIDVTTMQAIAPAHAITELQRTLIDLEELSLVLLELNIQN
jgi:2-polyprenyl-3-methyl-5-hydroxy-6-metoxy-1,4-benzoquinol methylase